MRLSFTRFTSNTSAPPKAPPETKPETPKKPPNQPAPIQPRRNPPLPVTVPSEPKREKCPNPNRGPAPNC